MACGKWKRTCVHYTELIIKILVIGNLFDNQRYPLEAKMKQQESSKSVHDPVGCYRGLKKAARCWAQFSSEPNNGRDLFRVENFAAIKALSGELVSKNSGGAFSAALKIMWDGADQDEWETRARAKKDVNKYVSTSSAMNRVLQRVPQKSRRVSRDGFVNTRGFVPNRTLGRHGGFVVLLLQRREG